MFSSHEDVTTYCREHNIEMLDLKAVDLAGRWRHVTLPVDAVDADTLRRGIGIDGSNYDYTTLERSDMLLLPNPGTGFVDPFWERPTLSLLADIYLVDGEARRCPLDPRWALERAIDLAGSTMGDILLGPEYEFYLFDRVAFEDIPGRAGYEVVSSEAEWSGGPEGDGSGYVLRRGRGYHAVAPVDRHQDLRSDIVALLRGAGVDVKYHHHEVGGPGQQEIEVPLAPALKAADHIMLIKYFVKNAARRRGLTATFMPKPIHAEAGSGMHVHFLVRRGEEPVFHDPEGYAGLSPVALQCIGGMLRHAPALLGLAAPSTSSYRRLVPGYEAPVSICFGVGNRSSVIRIPGYAKTPARKRFEFRPGDATCNPYLFLAGLIMAAVDGVERGIDPRAEGFGPYDQNVYELPEDMRRQIKPLPTTLRDALAALEAGGDFLQRDGVFPPELLQAWQESKSREAAFVEERPTPADFVRYYDC